MVHKSFMTLFAVLLLSSLAFSQSGKISGKVLDRETGDALPGANVVVVGTTLGAATDVSGEFVILSVPTGVYSLKASFIGYRDVTIDNIRVSSGLTTALDFGLPSEALEVSEISIVAERPLVNRNATNAVRIQGYEDFKNLPIRGVAAAVALQPGIVTVNNAIFIRGGRENDTGFYLEGASVRDKMGDASSALGGDNPVGVIPEALEEFQIQAGGYTAEFGGANAGIVRQTLKSGGPEYGLTVQFETDDVASQGDEFLSTNSFGYKDFTATFSGPVPGTDNKLRFFVAGQRRLMDDRIQRFNRGFRFEHSDTPDFANNRFPFILETNRLAQGEELDEDGYSPLERRLQKQGLFMPSGNVPNAEREEWIGNGTLVYDAKPFIFRIGGSLSWRQQDEVVGNFSQMLFNQNRIEQEEVSTALVNAKLTHLVGSKSFYEVNFNYFDRREFQYDPIFKDNFWAYWDSTASAQKGIQFTSLINPWQGGTLPMELYGFDFEAPGSPANSNMIKNKRGYVGGSFNFTTQLPQHEVKFGASYERWTARNMQYSSFDARRALVGARNNPDIYRAALAGDAKALREFAVLVRGPRLSFGYDVFGNEIDVDGVDGPRHPKYFSAYLQDKFEANDLVINAGVRVDVIDNDDFEFTDNSAPPWDRDFRGLDEDKLIETDADVEISPRLGIAFPVTDRTVFHMQYGRFVQAPRLTDLYNGSIWYDAVFTGGTSFQTNTTGQGLDPEVTTQYEIGFNQQFTDNAAFDVTTFYKNIRDQITLLRVVADPTSGARDYNILTNGDFATTAGVEMSLTLRRTSRVQGQMNFTFSRALGTGSVPSSTISAIETEETLPTIISPLDFHRSISGSFTLDYRFGRGDGGPILEQLGANMLFTFRSGHPYTLSKGDLGQQDESLGGQITDPRSREPLESINDSTTPWNFQINLRLDKTVNFGKFNTNFYVYVLNLLNRENVINVFNRSGNAFNDSFLDDPALSASVLQARENLASQNGLDPSIGRQAYEALYRAINLGGNGLNYRQDQSNTSGLEVLGFPRQIRFGARFEF